MRHERLLSAATRGSVAAFFILSLSLAACGGGGGGAASGGTITIASDLPVSGTDAAVGLPTQYGVELAVSQNTNLGNGYTLKFTPKNDEGASGADPTVGAANIRSLLADPTVMAIVGPFNSGVAASEIPVAENGGIVLMSPTNTNPGLTKEQYAQANGINFAQLHPSGVSEYYFRVCATDDVQGKVDAQIAAAPINAKTAYVVDDSTTYGKGLANFFTQNFTQNGGTVVGNQSISAAQVSSLPSLASTIASKSPDVVFYGGVTSQGGGALKKDLVAANYTKAMVGGDGIADDPGWLTTAGSASANTYGTVAAPDTSSLTSSDAAKFKTDYATFVAGKPNNTLLPYSAQAYAAAQIEIAAIKSVISSGKAPTRSAVRDAIASGNFNTIIGTISFDKNGDNSGQKVFSIYATSSDGSSWTFDKSVTA